MVINIRKIYIRLLMRIRKLLMADRAENGPLLNKNSPQSMNSPLQFEDILGYLHISVAKKAAFQLIHMVLNFINDHHIFVNTAVENMIQNAAGMIHTPLDILKLAIEILK